MTSARTTPGYKKIYLTNLAIIEMCAAYLSLLKKGRER